MAAFIRLEHMHGDGNLIPDDNPKLLRLNPSEGRVVMGSLSLSKDETILHWSEGEEVNPNPNSIPNPNPNPNHNPNSNPNPDLNPNSNPTLGSG